MWRIFSLHLLFIAASASAAGSGGGAARSPGKGEILWGGLGFGAMTVKTPEQKVDLDGVAAFYMGGDFNLLGPLVISVAAMGELASGTMLYDYTDTNAVHYNYSQTTVGLTNVGASAGLALRVINRDNFRVFVEGGGFLTKMTTNYSFPLTAGTVSIDAQKTQKDIGVSGTYAAVGVDQAIFNGYGLRIIGRASKGWTGKVNALGDQPMHFVQGLAMLAVFKKF